MSDYFLGEIRMFGFAYAPTGWAQCNGAVVAINQYQALFALLGTYYGGNGTQTFALPDLRSRTPIGLGTAPDGTQIMMGQTGGVETVSLTVLQMPAHNHNVAATTTAADVPAVTTATALIAATGTPFYGAASSLVALAPQSVVSTGSGQPHSNLQPYLATNYCIALVGIFPSRN